MPDTLAARFPIETLSQNWEDVRDETSVTTDLVEQAHGSGAILLKLHDRLEMDVLQDRSVIHQCRCLSKTSEEQRSVGRCKKHIDGLVSKSAQKRLGASHVLRSHYMKRENALPRGTKQSVKITQGLHEACRDTHPAIKREATSRAAAVHKRRMEEMHEEMVRLRYEIKLRRDRARRELLDHGEANQNECSRWSELGQERLKELYDEFPQQKQYRAEEDREDGSPGVPSSAEQSLFHAVETQMVF